MESCDSPTGAKADGDDRRTQQRQRRAANYSVNGVKQGRALLPGYQYPFDNHDGVIDQHTEGDDQRPSEIRCSSMPQRYMISSVPSTLSARKRR